MGKEKVQVQEMSVKQRLPLQENKGEISEDEYKNMSVFAFVQAVSVIPRSITCRVISDENCLKYCFDVTYPRNCWQNAESINSSLNAVFSYPEEKHLLGPREQLKHFSDSLE